MTRPSRPALSDGLLAVGLAVGLALSVDALRRVVQRLAYATDLNFWSEDYFMTSMQKLAAGTPVLTSVADANSTIYSPGQAYLHYALLAPFGAATSLTANRMLAQGWQLAAIAIGTVVGVDLLRRWDVWPPSRFQRVGAALLIATALLLCAYSNPVADALHPTNLEELCLVASAWALLRYPELSPRRQWASVLLLPALAFLAKQSAGAAVALALAWVALRSGSKPRAIAAALSPVLTALALDLWTRGMFRVWGIEILAAHHFEASKVWDLYGGLGRWYALLALVSIMSVRRGNPAVRRVALLGLIYAPFAIAALFKVLGGPNNLSSLGFVLALGAVPTLIAWARTWPGTAVGTLSSAALLLQLVVWFPQRYVPTTDDEARAEAICSYAAERLRCGERVWLGRGATCYARGGHSVPLDRMTSIHEVGEAGRFAELGLLDRIRHQEYDVILLHQADLTWLGPRFWPLLNASYRLFHASEENVHGDYWIHGFQGYGSRRVLYFERKRDAGTHRAGDARFQCKG